MSYDDDEIPKEVHMEVAYLYERALGDNLDPVWDEDGIGFTMICPGVLDDPTHDHRVPVRPEVVTIYVPDEEPPTARGPAG